MLLTRPNICESTCIASGIQMGKFKVFIDVPLRRASKPLKEFANFFFGVFHAE